jgi:hypothetical protein
MFIPVVFHNGDCCLIDASALDDLIASGEISQFLRLEGWVHIGCDSIRLRKSPSCQKERRQTHHSLAMKRLVEDISVLQYV